MQKGRFDQRRTGQGYKAPAERDGCRNCAHRSAAALGADPDGRIAFNCKLGGFFVAPGGICSKHQLPGIPEAEDEVAKADALAAWLAWCGKRKSRDGVQFAEERS